MTGKAAGRPPPPPPVSVVLVSPLRPLLEGVTFRPEWLCCLGVSAAAGWEEELHQAPQSAEEAAEQHEQDGGATVMFSFDVNLVCLLLDLVVCSVTSALGEKYNDGFDDEDQRTVQV